MGIRSAVKTPIRQKPRHVSRPRRSFHIRKPVRTPKPVSLVLQYKSPVDLSSVKMTPVFTAALLMMILVGSGLFDAWILISGPVEEGPFPGDALPVVSVQKASIDLPTPHGASAELIFTRHRVMRDETLSRISYKYGLSPNTLISINGLNEPGDIEKGVQLIVPYTDGVRVESRPGETSSELAIRFETQAEMVQLIPGTDDYFISGGNTDDSSLSSNLRDVFLYPVTGRILTAFGEGMDNLTGISYQSEGIDLSVESGTPVNASRDGTVILTGHHASYGLYVIISHPGAWKSFYGHLSRVSVAPGDTLERGASLGISGASGTARSPRLHFALIHDNESVDPLDYLY